MVAGCILFCKSGFSDIDSYHGKGLGIAFFHHPTAASSVFICVSYQKESAMTLNFTLILAVSVLFSLPVLGYIWWRFGGSNTLSFAILSGGFTAVMDLISSFVVRNYEYPGQSVIWVFAFIFFGWIGMYGSCLFIAEGILARPGQDLITQKPLRWQVPLLTAVIAVVLDLFIDPVAVEAEIWVWFVKGTVYYKISLLNYVGWFVLMLLAPLSWIRIARHCDWSYVRKSMVSVGALLPLCLASIALLLILNGAVAILVLQ
jgi:putative membrane protein